MYFDTLVGLDFEAWLETKKGERATFDAVAFWDLSWSSILALDFSVTFGQKVNEVLL